MYELVVKQAFSVYHVGSVITDQGVIDYITQHPSLSRNVVRRLAAVAVPALAPEAPADETN